MIWYIATSLLMVTNFIWLFLYIKQKKNTEMAMTNQKTRASEVLESKELELGMVTIQFSMLREIVQQFLPKTVWQKAEELSYEGIPEFEDEYVEATFLFLDIVGFTNFAENKSPEEVMKLLNTTFEPIIKAIYENDGDIDKFIGDACFAIFQKPRQAVVSAIKAIKENNSNPFGLAIRIGVHTGSVIRGNLGTHQRRDNTMIGSNVNIAARLESAARPGRVLISEEVYRALGEEFQVSKPHRLRVKGIDKDLRVYFLEIAMIND